MQYFSSKEGCFSRTVDYKDKTTWITHEEVLATA